MTKNYFYIATLLVFFFTFSLSAQETKSQSKTQDNTSIEGLNLYPNPVSNGKVYITSKNDSDKNILIFDVLGKKVLQTTISSRELSVSNLSPGVYIIKINEGEATATRKLIVK
ncbi:T9SS type A sorting domain-containing protein [Flavobacterium eburneipallidum]|uniref:T9SS type A sorting domain-containing protein n=1 Tax=Flavobacterium eburneipallidum TaxID=3003263 RepID=UPI002483020B|nr:T9SS type A sorting domain-containing protein [Flavobacterium eburneipallidum]